MALVSVIVPAWNRSALIEQTLDSVLAQTHRPIEMVVVDDGSTDDTPKVVSEWSARRAAPGFEARLVTQPNAGAPAARNRGLQETRGELIQFLDSDDLLHPEKLARQARVMVEDDTVDYVWSDQGGFDRVPDWQGEVIIGRPPLTVERMILGPVINTLSGVYRRRTCERIGPWDTSLSVWQDWNYNLRMMLAGVHAVYIPGVLSLFRTHERGRVSDRAPSPEALRSLAAARALLVARTTDRAALEALLVRVYTRAMLHAVQSGRGADFVPGASAAVQGLPRDVATRAKHALLLRLSALPDESQRRLGTAFRQGLQSRAWKRLRALTARSPSPAAP